MLSGVSISLPVKVRPTFRGSENGRPSSSLCQSESRRLSRDPVEAIQAKIQALEERSRGAVVHGVHPACRIFFPLASVQNFIRLWRFLIGENTFLRGSQVDASSGVRSKFLLGF